MCGHKPIASWGLENKSHREGESSHAALPKHRFVVQVRNVTMLHFLMGQGSQSDNLAGWKEICTHIEKLLWPRATKRSYHCHMSAKSKSNEPELVQVWARSRQTRTEMMCGPDGGQSWFIQFEAQILQTGADRPSGVIPRGMWAGWTYLAQFCYQVNRYYYRIVPFFESQTSLKVFEWTSTVCCHILCNHT